MKPLEILPPRGFSIPPPSLAYQDPEIRVSACTVMRSGNRRKEPRPVDAMEKSSFQPSSNPAPKPTRRIRTHRGVTVPATAIVSLAPASSETSSPSLDWPLISRSPPHAQPVRRAKPLPTRSRRWRSSSGGLATARRGRGDGGGPVRRIAGHTVDGDDRAGRHLAGGRHRRVGRAVDDDRRPRAVGLHLRPDQITAAGRGLHAHRCVLRACGPEGVPADADLVPAGGDRRNPSAPRARRGASCGRRCCR